MKFQWGPSTAPPHNAPQNNSTTHKQEISSAKLRTAQKKKHQLKFIRLVQNSIMDDSYYANLLANEPSASSSQQPVLLSVILSRKTLTHSNQANASIRLAVAARIPRKRSDCTDPVKYTLQYFSFLDDRRRFTNFDALLTRLSPVGVVHVSCTESTEVR